MGCISVHLDCATPFVFLILFLLLERALPDADLTDANAKRLLPGKAKVRVSPKSMTRTKSNTRRHHENLAVKTSIELNVLHGKTL